MRNPIIPLFVVALLVVAAIMVGQLHLSLNFGGNGKSSSAQPNATVLAQHRLTATAIAMPVNTPTQLPTLEPTPTFQVIPPQLQAQIDTIEKGAADLRGLTPLDHVPETFLTRDKFREQYKKEMQAAVPVEQVQQYLQQLWMLRLVKDPSIDFYQASADLGSDNILGYYDPIQKKLFVITDKPEVKLDTEAEVTLAHEYVHSLQDQNYKLAKLWPVGAPDQDRELAVRSLIEGDATLSGYAWAATYMNGKDFRSLFDQKTVSTGVANKTPPYLGTNTIFPYTAGTEFVTKLIDVGGFSTVNLALQDPPRSTEQIMHPEKYLQVPVDQPKLVTIPDLMPPLGAPWALKQINTLGEFDLNMMLRENGASNPDKGADGWGGGKFAMYTLAQEVLVYSSVVWDTQNDANEFYGAMYETFAKDPQEKDTGMWTDGGRTFWMRLNGDRVDFVSSTNRPALDRVIAAVK